MFFSLCVLFTASFNHHHLPPSYYRGVASAVGLYYVSAVSTLTTVLILRYARLPNSEEEPGFSWTARPLEEVQDTKTEVFEVQKSSGLFGHQLKSSKAFNDALREQYRNDLEHVIKAKAPDILRYGRIPHSEEAGGSIG